jgi:DNA-binding MarR family transcriptional regulator
MLQEHGFGANEYRLLDLHYHHPLVNVTLVSSRLGVTDVTASRLIDRLAGLGLLDEVTGRRRNRVYRYTPYWELFREPRVLEESLGPVEETSSLP